MTSPIRDRARATVVAGSLCIDYLVEGSGSPLVLIATNRARWMDEFGPDARVIAPEARCGDHPSLEWLDDFLDGLGLERVALAIEERFASLVDELAPSVRERLTEVRLLESSVVPANAGGSPVIPASAGIQVQHQNGSPLSRG